MWTEKFQMFKLDLKMAEESEIKSLTSTGSQKKQENSRIPNFCFIEYAKVFDCMGCNKQWKILKEMGIPDHLTWLLRNLCSGQEATVRTEHGTRDWFQIGKGIHQGCTLSPAYLTSMQSTSYEMPSWMKRKLESSLSGEISITSDMQMTPPLYQKAKKN